jgi:hypothetical protein
VRPDFSAGLVVYYNRTVQPVSPKTFHPVGDLLWALTHPWNQYGTVPSVITRHADPFAA